MTIKDDILALQNSFSLDMKFMGGDMSLSPHATPVLSHDDVAPVWEVSHRGSPTAAGVKPP